MSDRPLHDPASRRPSPELVRQALQQIVDSAAFTNAGRARRFLTYIVEETLAGRSEASRNWSSARRCSIGRRTSIRGSRADNQHLQGGWVQTVVRDPGAPQLPPVQPSNALVLFTAEGGVMSHQNTINPPGTMASGGIGNWARVGNNEFAVTQKFAVAFVDASGGHDIGFFVQRLRLHYGSTTDELSGTADFALVDLNGNVIFSAPFHVVLQRVPVQQVGEPF